MIAMTTIGFLHPGAMGTAMAAALPAATTALWASQDRSRATAQRADGAGLVDAGTVDRLCRDSDVVVSICPPSAAGTVAAQVASLGFVGIYVDANAIAPTTSSGLSTMFDRYVDGGVIGPPPTDSGTTRLYLAGPDASTVADLWAGSTLEAVPIDAGHRSVAASALKMAYAGWTKGSSALLISIDALARAHGIDRHLAAEWERSQPGLVERVGRTAPAVGPKAWRFEGEMEEIAATMLDVGLPDGFHRAAAETYSRLAGFKDVRPDPAATAAALLVDTATDSSTDAPTNQNDE